MDTALVVWSATSAAIGSLVTGYALASIQHRRSIRDAGKAEVLEQMRLARFEAVRRLNGEARGLYHCLSHVMNDSRAEARISPGTASVSHYAKGIREYAARMRGIARSEVYILGESYVASVHEVTDIANLIADITLHSATQDQQKRMDQITAKWTEHAPKWKEARISLTLDQAFDHAFFEMLTLAASPDSSHGTKSPVQELRAPGQIRLPEPP